MNLKISKPVVVGACGLIAVGLFYSNCLRAVPQTVSVLKGDCREVQIETWSDREDGYGTQFRLEPRADGRGDDLAIYLSGHRVAWRIDVARGSAQQFTWVDQPERLARVAIMQGPPKRPVWIDERKAVRNGAATLKIRGDRLASFGVINFENGRFAALVSASGGSSLSIGIGPGTPPPPTEVDYHVQLYRLADNQLVVHYKGNTGQTESVIELADRTWLVDEKFLVTRFLRRRSLLVCRVD